MGIRNAQTTLDQYYTVRDDLLTGKIQSYMIGDRQITLINMKDLDKMIQYYESAVTANSPIVADLRFTGAGSDGSQGGYYP